MRRWTGPWVVTRKISSVNYEITFASRKKKPIVVHVEQLEPYVERMEEDSAAEEHPLLENCIVTKADPSASESYVPQLSESAEEGAPTEVTPTKPDKTGRELRKLKIDRTFGIGEKTDTSDDSAEEPKRTRKKLQRLLAQRILLS